MALPFQFPFDRFTAVADLFEGLFNCMQIYRSSWLRRPPRSLGRQPRGRGPASALWRSSLRFSSLISWMPSDVLRCDQDETPTNIAGSWVWSACVVRAAAEERITADGLESNVAFGGVHSVEFQRKKPASVGTKAAYPGFIARPWPRRSIARRPANAGCTRSNSTAIGRRSTCSIATSKPSPAAVMTGRNVSARSRATPSKSMPAPPSSMARWCFRKLTARPIFPSSRTS